MTIDFDGINAAALTALESLLTEWFPAGHREGHEYKVGSLSGEPGRSLSINTRTGIWKDFSTDAGGSDPISLLAAIRSGSMKDAAIELAERFRTGIQSERVRAPAKVKAKAPDWEPITAPDGTALPSPMHHPRHGKPSAAWEYRDANGRLIGAVCRFDLPTGKDVIPFAWCRHPDGRAQFRWLSFAKPRPLYGLDMLAAKPKAGVLIVEGEKAADAARTISPGVVITWPGGGKAVKHADWTPLRGRKVLVWPDRDKAGFEAAQAVVKALSGIATSVRIVTPPIGPMDGWDLADAVAEGWDADRFVSWVKAKPAEVVEPIETLVEIEPELADMQVKAPSEDDRIQDLPFRLLGTDDDQFFYMPDQGQQIVRLTASAHSKLNLMRLAPLQLWEQAYPEGWDASANALIQKNKGLPKFDPRRIRGRGCWLDGGDVVYHAGDKLIVNGGKGQPVTSYRSNVRAIYEGSLEIPVDASNPANNRTAHQLIQLCGMLSFERPLHGKLLAGWLALAPVCGALGWRPHLWVTGPSGSGKSWTVANIIQPMVGPSAVHVQGNTSEAGIRGQLGSDALPVVFDEAESEDRASQLRFEAVLQLARQASSETGAGIVKGTATGGSVTYLVRSSFLFASIGVAAVKKADVSRLTVLPLKKNLGADASEKFERLREFWAATIGQDGFAESIRVRSLRSAKTLRANCETFCKVAVHFTGDKRSADQIGTLLAGAYSLTSTNAITEDAARDWMAGQDWSGFRSDESDNDEHQCLAYLFAASIRYEIDGRAVTRSIAEAVALASGTGARTSEEVNETKDALKRHGIVVRDDRAYVANKHPALDKIFADTAWAAGKWKLHLERVTGADKHDVMAFGTHVRQRAVSVPV
jgi:putative DNA primase/helicase